ncbi:ABC transporter ATP-binding protein [Mycoplasma mycoides]|uniref:Maltodextrin ABC transporter ATP binding protein n=1 Tax=Mycoplasma mycoides subsp. capri LC str. 95010 TaxID=862259 RepID=F4MP77_MYCML|nr:ABC transporter ATP-binding protein [Mycoplasma mycoides]ADH21796.1 multiple sugar-binding transport ATP-binding protein MsmK [synthetic Mycoplasma mycoides JCVI-syn1.0]ACU78692.1 multiple sugar-binding transport ATP-binding protein MsmK [Mycoplasma mycoides subsp. capri str. GM12]ACU79523.1 multiple sugar-binding transport ATP-binding protein MsmK [Mycoplasma mycoides subsp. capri str. GM12]MDP4040383.1 ABC transporter ATP-binding protein [Mycoplasma mycoides]MDP4041247.1 ABC transporter A
MKVELRNISKKYEGNSFYTLENIDLTINDNDFCVILGPSGCGKTTLLRIIAGLNSITKGDLLFDGVKVNNLLPKDRDIAMVFQSYALYPHYNVYKNLAFGLEMKKEKKEIINHRVRGAAKLLNIEKYLFKKPKELSGGQQQRVALGRAIVRKPKLFLMDEPLSNLDAKLRESMRTELVSIHRILGTTTIYVTHDQLEAMTMATKIVLMNNQVIQQVGKPEEFYNKPNNLFVAKFIGTPTMNVLEGKLENNYFISNINNYKVELSDEELELIKKEEVTKLYLGIRSEDAQLVKTTDKTANIVASVINTELLGMNKQVTCELTPGNNFVITTSKDNNIKIDDKVGIKIHKYHLFNGITENRIG